MTYLQSHWFLKDLQYTYLDDGFTLVATTDVPCHLYARMTTTPPRKHALSSMRRGLRMFGDIRFCFVVYEDNEQVEAGDTLTHTFVKSAWPICETRWFYFLGSINGIPVASESPIFKFHFPAPPPEPPPPITRYFFASGQNRSVYQTGGAWPPVHDAPSGTIHGTWGPPANRIYAGDQLTASYFIWRGFLDFDTSVIPDTAIITSANLYIYPYVAVAEFVAKPFLYITRGFQSIPVVPTNYGDQLPYTFIHGQVDINSLTPWVYNSIPFLYPNDGIINLFGLTKLCLRGQRDVEDFPFIVVSNNWCWFASLQAGAGLRPYLEVNYYPA